MKNIVFVLTILFSMQCFAFEDIPVLPQDSGVSILYVDNQQDLINVDGMKKADKVKNAQNMVNENEKPRLRFDSRQLIHQRALDYTTRQNNMMLLPRF